MSPADRRCWSPTGVVAATYFYVVHRDNNDEIGAVEDVVPESFLGGPGVTHTLSDEVRRYVEMANLDPVGPTGRRQR